MLRPFLFDQPRYCIAPRREAPTAAELKTLLLEKRTPERLLRRSELEKRIG
jgi:hypothetical protein